VQDSCTVILYFWEPGLKDNVFTIIVGKPNHGMAIDISTFNFFCYLVDNSVVMEVFTFVTFD
jgi:hypothetical protein